MMHRPGRVGWGIAVLLVASPLAQAALLSVGPAADNTLFETTDGSISNGAGPDFYVGSTASANHRRGVLRFDLSAIPAGSTIDSVTLSLSVTMSPPGSLMTPIGIHALNASWGEGSSFSTSGIGAASTTGDATWIHRSFNTTPWATPGGDFAAAELATTLVGGTGSTASWSSPGLVASVQSWVDSPADNFGWILIGDEANLQTARRFASRENTTASLRPVLTINYTAPIPEPAGLLATSALGAATLLRRRR